MWDIYALGIILSDLICNPVTGMEQMRIDDCIKANPPRLPKGYQLEDRVEGRLMLKMVDRDPKNRPSID